MPLPPSGRTPATIAAHVWASPVRRYLRGGEAATVTIMNDRTTFRSTAALTGALVLVALLVLVLHDPGRFHSVLNFGPPRANGDVAAGAPQGSQVAPIDAAHPFAGSPAADWPAGVEGIKLPAAERVGSFSATEVATALDLTKRYVAATRLDPRVIAGQYPTGVFALIDPKHTGLRNRLADALRRPGPDRDPATYITRLAPHLDLLHGSIIKVNGAATVRERSPGELVVSTDSLIVYAVRRVAPPSEVTRLVLREQLELATYHGRDTTAGKVWPERGEATWAGAWCTAPDGYLHPEYMSEWRRSSDTGADPYDIDRPIADGSADRCRPISRV
jgi:hypothetical protein